MILSLILIVSVSSVSAQDNETSVDTVSLADLDSLEAGNAVINVHVSDSYDSSNKTWIEEGVDLAGATVNVYDSSNKLVSSQITDKLGNVAIKNLNSAKYSVEISYSTYEKYTQSVDLTNKNSYSMDYIFVPDILLLADYGSHNEKIDVLMNMSKRVAYISTMDFDKTREWLFDYANYIHVDMFAEGSYNTLTAQYLKELLKFAPANENYKVAYTFGIYDNALLNSTGIHIVGASASNNTFHTVENTYIGSYFQAEDIEDSEVLLANMKNYLAYVYYLINPNKYANPTLDSRNAPLLSPECGFYHPDLGMYTLIPEGTLINNWILSNPGYSGIDGSLKWMIKEYPEWLENILDPTKLFKQFESDYIKLNNPEQPFIVIATYYCGGDTVDSLIRGYEDIGRPAFNVFKTSTAPSMSSILTKINRISNVGFSAITSLYSWSLNLLNGSAEEDLYDINIPVLKGVYDISQSSYESELGPQIEWTYMVTYPSFEGVYGPVVLSYVDAMGKSHVIQSGVDKMIKLSNDWANLKDMNNSDKTVSILLYNYPPGKAEIGASYLDVFQSTYDLLLTLDKAGYDVDMNLTVRELTDFIVEFGNKGTWVQGLLNDYVEKYWDQLMEHNQLIDLNEFYELTSGINPSLYEEMINYWGDGLGGIMVYNNTYIVIPGMWFGNIFVSFQPSRGWEEVKNYHDLTLPPHQQYVAFYEWLDQKVNCDVIINMGTHSTLEWLPGKNIGVMDGDWTFELTLTPTVYPYIVSNPGEAMVARDRIAALMITHMTPAMVSSELYGNYTVLLDYISHYKDQVKLNVTSNAEEYKQLILELAPTLGFANISDSQTFEEWIDELHIYLDDMENDFFTYGLHSLGKILTGDELIEEVITVVTSQTMIYDEILGFLYPSLAGKSYYDDIKGNLQYLGQAEAVKEFLKVYVSRLVNGTSPDVLNREYGIAANSSLYNSTIYAAQVILNIENNHEWEAIVAALNGNYIAAGLFADPAYGDSIPTGWDGYASDSTKMPSKSAYSSAVKIVDLLLADYMEEHGRWPELNALILWGTEISRTEGIGIAEFLYFLGCRPVWTNNGKVIGVEIIPLEDLTIQLNNGSVVNRPRVDVFASMVTSNKDWITWMLTAINLAAFAEGEDETNNYVIKHYKENPSLDRLFGLPGAILEGTGMSTFIPNTADWNITTVNSVAADIYLNKVSYSWTLDEKGNIVITQQRENYERLLSNVDLVTQNFDSTWRFLDSDDYYDWFTGLQNAAKILGNDHLDTRLVDIRNQNNYVSRSFEEEINFELRTLLNPKYYEPLLDNDAGYLSYSSRIQNLYASLLLSGGTLDPDLAGALAGVLNSNVGSINSVSKASGFQASAAWMVYMHIQGITTLDPQTLTDLADNLINVGLMYGFACCHHTCANINFVSMVIQLSSLSPEKKQEYSEKFSKATLTNPIYTMENNQGQSDANADANDNNDDGKQSETLENSQDANTLANGTIKDSSNTDNAMDGGQTAVGDDYSSDPSDAKVDPPTSDVSQSADGGAGSNEAGGSKSYELSQQSVSKSSGGESSMPALVIMAVIALVAIFFVGYVRNNKDDEY